MEPQIQRLPPELFRCIIDFITRPSDLKTLCLTSENFQNAATPALYRNITLDRKTPTWPRLEPGRGLLSVTNRGIRHVQALVCKATHKSMDKDLKNYKDELQSIQMLLSFLPRHQLSQVNLSTIPLEVATISLLLAQQSAIQRLALGPITTDLRKHLHLSAFGPEPWKWLQELEIPRFIWNALDLDAYGTIIQKAPRLSHLSIHECSQAEVTKRSDRDKNVEKNKVLSKLFTDETPNLGQHRIPLLSLHLDQVDASIAAPRFPQYFEICKLQKLHMSDCKGWKSILETITKHYTEDGSSLRCFSFDHWNGYDGKSVIEQFLRSFRGLEILRYTDSRGTHEPPESALDLTCLDSHLETLQQLVSVPAAGTNDGSRAAGMADEYFEKVATSCPNLQQLGIIMPKISTTGMHENHEWYSKTLTVLLSLQHLKILRIFNWPDPEHVSHPTLPQPILQLVRNQDIVEQIEDAFEEEIYESLRSKVTQEIEQFIAGVLAPALDQTWKGCGSPIVCFSGMGDNTVQDGDGFDVFMDSLCYVPLRKIDFFGRNEVIAQRVSIMDARYLEPENDILHWRVDG